MTELPGGLVLRTARATDLDGLDALLSDRGEPADGEDLRLVAADTGLDDTGVVVDGDRVVATATLLAETVYVGGVALPAGQIELVATDRAYEGRGLVRALVAWCHERSAARGDLVQVMVGIPYFYRQFGYEYAVPMPRSRELVVPPPAPPPGLVVRPAGRWDLDAMAALQSAEQSRADVWMPHAAECWRWLVQRHGSQELVVEAAGTVVANARVTPPDEGVVLGELAASRPDAALALVHHALDLGGGRASAKERPGTLAGEAVEPLLAEAAKPDWYYLRLPDPVALLEALRPVLDHRLEAAGALPATERELLVSAFRWHVRCTVGPGGVGPMRGGGPLQAPGAAGGSGVAPDRFASLLFGPHGAAGLAEREPDVYLAGQDDLMAVLFPPVRADLLTFFLP